MIVLTDKQIAEIIGKVPIQGRIYWETGDLPEVKIALRALRLTSADESFQIDGVMPYWLYLAILAALAPKKVYFNTPNHGPIEIPVTEPEGAGQGVVFSTYEDEQFTLVQFMTPRTLQANELSTIVAPVVNPKKGVVISSNAPFWVIGTVAQAYATRTRWVACTQKSGGAIVAVSNDRGREPGAEIKEQLINDVIAKAASVPKRGEVWMFDAGYGEHPCLIMSQNERNEKANDVLIVPFTSSEAYARRNLLVVPSMTGLTGSSYAQCSNVSRITKDQLLAGPISKVKDELMLEVVRRVRQAIGDAA
jgi:CRISPR-associated Csx3 family protein